MIYRLLVDYSDPRNAVLNHLYQLVGRAVPIPWNKRVARRLAGGSFGPLALIMFREGLRSPAISNRRARFYFTERGWSKVGRHVAAEARRLGHIVKIVRRKEPDRSQIIYRDLLQVAILPKTRRI
ncbi:MAG TPA: hypothetical protein VNJ31_04720 [Methyloceanibacter sp.]|nr:hypothetical protein [Methyloceanibacter sp.]